MSTLAFVSLPYIEDSEEYLKEINSDKVANLLSEMDSDDAVDILEKLGDDERKRIVALLDNDEKQDVRMILSYDDDEIGSEMTVSYTHLCNSAVTRITEFAEC